MKTPIAIGQVFVHQGEKYLLAQTGKRKASLINMPNGNRLVDAIKVVDIQNITTDEWFGITFGQPQDFVLKERY